MNDYLLITLLIISFGVIIWMVASRKEFSLAIIVGTLLMAISIPEKIPDILLKTATDYKVISLIAIVVMIKMLAVILQETGLLQGVINVMQEKLSYKGMLIAIPSILGLLPVPGGALLSAPLIDVHGKVANVKKELLMAINLWYRHIWFIIFPLATPLVLLADFSGENIFKIIGMQIPLFLLAFFTGYFFVRKVGNVDKRKEKKEGNLKGLLPILIPVSIAMPLSFFISTYSSFLISLPIGIFVAWLISEKKSIEIIKKGISVSLAVAIFGIMFLKNVIFASRIPDVISSHLIHLPIVFTVATLSFIIGLLTAHNLAAIGILYPILSPFLDNIGLINLLYISSFMGYLISPIHPCVVLTYDYFRPKFTDAYKLLIPPSIAIVIIAGIFYGIII
ncbi:MAG TPA: DUF401 family protein [Thermoplasmatales archaeon]|nr:DUF401 family protein [Thermoplasmatales archaeon]